MAVPATDLQRRRRWPADLVAERLRSRRGALGLTYEEVSDRLARALPLVLGPTATMALSPGKVRNVLGGGSWPKLLELPVWAVALETNQAYLLGFASEEDPDPMLPSLAAIVGRATPGALKSQIRRLFAVPDPDRSNVVQMDDYRWREQALSHPSRG